MTGSILRCSTLALVGLSFALLAAAFVVSPGLFTIDEVIYYAGAEALRNDYSLVVENGFSQLHAEGLKLWLLVEGPSGLVPQYPVGSAFLGAPLLAMFGVRGLIIMNALAAIGTLFATRTLAKQLFNDDTVALVSVLLLFAASFWLEYALGIWPHSVSMLCVVLALITALKALSATPGSHVSASACGFIIGCGLLFRTDTALVLPALATTALLYGDRPLRMLSWGGLGLLPPLAVAAWANLEKFGTLNPLSYGLNRGGGVDLSTHIAPIVALALLLALLLAARRSHWQPPPGVGLGVAAGFITLLLLVPVARDLSLRYLHGIWALLIDATSIVDPRPGVKTSLDDTLLFWGLVKKSLGQSMPWLGLTLMLVTARWQTHHRQSFTLVLVLTVIWTLPFCLLAWHGGLGSNMRYFLPILPALCALCAMLLLDLARSVTSPTKLLFTGFASGILLLQLWSLLHTAGYASAQQHASTLVLGITAVLALFAGLEYSKSNTFRQLTLAAVGCGLAFATMFMLSDMMRAQDRRTTNLAISNAFASTPEKSLVIGPPEYFIHQLSDPHQLVAVPDSLTNTMDSGLINKALMAGYRVFTLAFLVQKNTDIQQAFSINNTNLRYPGTQLQLTEIRCDHLQQTDCGMIEQAKKHRQQD